MTAMKRILAGAAVAAAAVVFGGNAEPAAAQQSNKDYSMLPGYSARPPGMCWNRTLGGDTPEHSGYWGACKSPANESANGARAQASLRDGACGRVAVAQVSKSRETVAEAHRSVPADLHDGAALAPCSPPDEVGE